MKDFFGYELAVGDEVAITIPGYKTLTLGFILAFTPTMVKVSYSDFNGRFLETRVPSDRVIKRP